MSFKIPNKIPSDLPVEVGKPISVDEEIAYYRRCVAEHQETIPKISEKAINKIMSGLCRRDLPELRK